MSGKWYCQTLTACRITFSEIKTYFLILSCQPFQRFFLLSWGSNAFSNLFFQGIHIVVLKNNSLWTVDIIFINKLQFLIFSFFFFFFFLWYMKLSKVHGYMDSMFPCYSLLNMKGNGRWECINFYLTISSNILKKLFKKSLVFLLTVTGAIKKVFC